MKISFVIPAYNEEAYVGKCLKSILKQIKGNNIDWEIIVVNNASTDRTREIALSYQGVKVIDEPRKGLPKARQAGYLAAQGDIIANVDADNMLPEGWIAKVTNEFSHHERLVGLSGPLIYHDLSKIKNMQVKMFYAFGYLSYLFTHFVLKKGGMLQGGNFVLKKSALDRVGGYNTEIDFYGEDTDIARRIQQAGYVKFTFKLPMYSSGRRMAKEGLFVTGYRYAMNYLWILVLKRPFTRTSTDVRFKKPSAQTERGISQK
jgi:glycosyltransferase involved in cell wall biosynthesis